MEVATADVVRAYLLADMEDYTVVVLKGKSVDLMFQMKPSYEKFITMENGKKVLYIQLIKVLYGCMHSALLWYYMFKGKLEKMGFKLNPYDLCVANKEICISR